MKSTHWIVAALLLVLIGVLIAGRLLSGSGEGGEGSEVAGTPAGAAPQPFPGGRAPPSGQEDVVAPPAASDATLPPLPDRVVDAGVSMQQALEKGDPAAPPLRREAPRDGANAAELADPAAYQRYEARQNQRLYNQYLQAADSEIPRLQADIARARAAGLAPEQIAEGEEKLRRIQAMRDQLQAEKGAAAP